MTPDKLAKYFERMARSAEPTLMLRWAELMEFQNLDLHFYEAQIN